MASVWLEGTDPMTNIVTTNTARAVVIKWVFVTFSGEVQDAVEIKWRPALVQSSASIRDLVGYPEDSTTLWTPTNFASLGTPDVAGKEYRGNSIMIPGGTFKGVYIFKIRVHSVGGTWSGWTSQKIDFDNLGLARQEVSGTAQSTTLTGISFPEGAYTLRVEVMNSAGLTKTLGSPEFASMDTSTTLRESGVDTPVAGVVLMPNGEYERVLNRAV